MKIIVLGSVVMWEEWARPQIVDDIYTMGYKLHGEDRPGDIWFADVIPLAPNTTQIGHAVCVDELVLIDLETL